MARFFIDRPVFAWVLAILIMGAGLLSIRSLPVSQYPDIASPQVSITARYPGASAETVENTVAQVIEQQLTGIDYLRYIQTQSDSDGNVTITITFENEADPDIAQVQVQNKLQSAMPFLPEEVRALGVTVKKSVRNFLIVYAFYTEGSLTRDDISDYIATNLKEPISRIRGVGDVQLFGSEYAMRIWLNADQMTNYNISIADISAALQAQNAQISAGQFGGAPAVEGQRLNASITIRTRLQSVEEFENLLLRVNTDGSRVLLADVARLELAGENAALSSFYNGNATSGMAIRPATGANALETVRLINNYLASQEEFFPQGLEYTPAYDTTPFVRISIEGVIHTLIEAIVLVFLVMYLFLGNFRATLIPTIAVPVVLLGTFAIMATLGFTINTLTMFGLVLAIGLLVDDAIVVVENVERVMTEEGISPRDATRKSMDQITGSLVAIALVLAAVFLPMAFFKGATGIIYRQFSVTIASAMALSVVVAITLTPALCATMLKPLPPGSHGHGGKGFFGWFNRTFNRGTQTYGKGVGGMLRFRAGSLIIYLCITGVMGWLFMRLPTAFLPEEDQGILLMQVQLPSGSTLEQTEDVIQRITHYFQENEADCVESVMGVAGFSFGGRGQNAGLGFIKLKNWEERHGESMRAPAVAGRAMQFFSTIKEAMVFAFPPPAIIELGTANGFEFQLIDRSNQGHDALMQARMQLLGLANAHPDMINVRPTGFNDVPQFRLHIDEEKASAFGLPLALINQTLATGWGSSYLGDFNYRGRVKKIFAQADAPFRMLPEDFDKWHIPGLTGIPVPVSAFASEEWGIGSPLLERFNGLPSIAIQGEAAPGKSSGDAIMAMEELMNQLPEGFSYAWTALSYEEKLSGAQAPMLYAISIIVVFLCLAALYESWAVPISVIMVIPLGVVGAVMAVWLRGLNSDIYFQVGLITTVGLSAKNAILIIAFAKQAFENEGMNLIEAAVHASKQRLRPILMTSLAFGLGVMPLAISTGAGSGSQNAIGTSVVGGVITGTLLTIFLVPVFYVVIGHLFRVKPKFAQRNVSGDTFQ